jgi:hypothetical protein
LQSISCRTEAVWLETLQVGKTAFDNEGRTIFVADARREDAQRFTVRADEKLTAFMELETAIRATAVDIHRKSDRLPSLFRSATINHLTGAFSFLGFAYRCREFLDLLQHLPPSMLWAI